VITGSTVAVELVRRRPATVAALCAGWITSAKARVILEETAELEVELLAGLEAQMLGKAAGLTPGEPAPGHPPGRGPGRCQPGRQNAAPRPSRNAR
jgi:hypothetical protein